MFSMRSISTVLVAALTLIAHTAWAGDTYPSKPLKIIYPGLPATAGDITLRRFAETLSVTFGQPVVIENHPGGNGIVAAQAALSAPRDGYTINMFSSADTIAIADAQAKGSNLSIPFEEFDALSGFETFSNVVAVSTASPFRTLPDILRYARENECKLNVGLTGVNTPNYLLARIFMYQTGVKFVMVPHTKIADLLMDAVRGQVPVLIQSYAAIQGQVDAGNLRPVAVSGPRREPYLPDVPTIAELGIEGLKGFTLPTWASLYTPKGVPAARRAYLSQKINEALRTPAVASAFKELAIEPLFLSAHQQDQLMHNEIKKWGDLFRSKKIYDTTAWCMKKLEK